MKISVYGRTDRGKRRPNNEDDLALVDLTGEREIREWAADDLEVGHKGVLLAVADGVGGRRAGEVASGLALDVLTEEVETLAPTCPRRDLFRTAVEHVNLRVWKEARAESDLVQSLVEAGALTAEEAERSPYRNVIMQAIGREKGVEVALDALEVTPGDLVFLCTDGLSDKVRPEEMAEILSSSGLREAVEGLIALANERGGEDNITALACLIEG